MKKKLSAIAVAMGVMTSASVLAESPYTNLYAFGDSLTDSGTTGSKATNDGATLGIERFAVTIQDNDFTNAFDAITMLPTGGTNFSVGAFNSSDVLTSILGADITPAGRDRNPLTGALADAFHYSLAYGTSIDKDAIYYVSGGGNDFLSLANDSRMNPALPGYDPVLAAQIAQETVLNGVQRIVTGAEYFGSLGANYIVVPNLVALEFAPGVVLTGASDSGKAFAEGFNTALEIALAGSNNNIIVVDNHLAMREFFADTQAYGFALDGATQSMICYDGCNFLTGSATGFEKELVPGVPNPNANADFFAFNDPIHPTGAGHALFSIQLDNVFTAPDVFGSMAQLALSDSRDQVEGVRSQMNALRYSDQGAGLILAGGYVDGDWGADLHMGADREMTSYTAGLHAPVGEDTRVAVALTSSSSEVMYGSSYGSDQYAGIDGAKLESDGMGIVASITHNAGALYFEVTPELTWGSMDTERDLRILQLDRLQTADTDFTSAGVTLSSGWDMLSADNIAFGPMIEYSYRNVTVDAFSENEMNSNALSVSKQRWKENLVGGGVFGNYQAGNFFVDASYRYLENLDDGRESLTMALQSIQANSFWLPTQMRTDEITDAQISAGYNFCDWMVKGQYRYQDAGAQGKNDLFNVSVSYAF